MDAQWAQHPPVHHLVASYLGYKPPAVSDGTPFPVIDIDNHLMDMGPMQIRKVAPLDTTAYDAAMAKEPTP